METVVFWLCGAGAAAGYIVKFAADLHGMGVF